MALCPGPRWENSLISSAKAHSCLFNCCNEKVSMKPNTRPPHRESRASWTQQAHRESKQKSLDVRAGAPWAEASLPTHEQHPCAHAHQYSQVPEESMLVLPTPLNLCTLNGKGTGVPSCSLALQGFTCVTCAWKGHTQSKHPHALAGCFSNSFSVDRNRLSRKA